MSTQTPVAAQPVPDRRPPRSPARLAAARLPGARGVLTGVAAVGATVLLVGALPWLSGRDVALSVLRAREADRDPDPATLAAVREQLDLPADPVSGTLRWADGLLRGDLGASWVSGRPVAETLLPAFGVSLTVAGTAALVTLVLAVLLALPALRRAAEGRTEEGRLAGVLAGALAALPEFVLAVLFVVVVAIGLGWAPTSGFSGPAHLVLPVLALALPAAGLLGRVLGASVRSTAGEAWVRTWRAAGARRRVLAAEVGRRALTSVVPLVLLLLVGNLGAAAVVEAVFDIPGLGGISLQAALAQDVPVVQAAVALLVGLGLLVGGGGVLLHRLLVGPALSGAGLTPEASPPAPRAGRWAVGVAAVLAAVVVAGLLRDPAAQDPARRLAPPSWAAPLGADPLGRDVLARFGHGALLSVGLALALSAVVLAVGLLVGLRAHRARAGLADVLNALPAVVVGIVVASVAGPGLGSAVLAVCLVAWIPLAVHARALAAEARASGFYVAAQTAGAGRWYLLRAHLLPLVAPPVTRHALTRLPAVALALAGLSFLGIGAGPESPEWGRTLADTAVYLERAPWVGAPAVGLVLLGVVASLVRTEG
ncbi:ABC transporter permease subunit [Geodermatophilus sp. DSM 44513]|uniref:ABC transporter permease subunit n=1 Tax=Geodermatophilus sp. DSM 44513 TaxID=1528104 RepID=UPI00126FB98A|nr:ABC transporter permease subunit [Geodermatophilus sp. DSM 44513]WNV76960.1 ABC transporter permease subunit [Geodermatophilus sp. DSM 44513]